MKLGWIDFSKNERNKVLSVIHLLYEPGAVDELGLGAIRDAFADYFFPGTSTVQTRTKYFLIVPYILKEACSGKYGSEIINNLVGYFYGHKNDYLILGKHYYWFIPLPDNLAVDLINRTTTDNLEYRDGAY